MTGLDILKKIKIFCPCLLMSHSELNNITDTIFFFTSITIAPIETTLPVT
jgi:hypothetical protein